MLKFNHKSKLTAVIAFMVFFLSSPVAWCLDIDSMAAFFKPKKEMLVILLDTSGSQFAEDNMLYMKALQTLSIKPCQQLLLAPIAASGVGSFSPTLHETAACSGNSVRDNKAIAQLKAKLITETKKLITETEKMITPSAPRSYIIETIQAVAPAVTSADRVVLVVLSDMEENTPNFSVRRKAVSASLGEKIAKERAIKFNANVHTFVIGAGNEKWSEAKYREVESFWRALLTSTGAQVKHYGRTVPTFEN